MTSPCTPSPARRVGIGLIAALLALPLAAQIPLGGTQSGTLPAGVYHTTGTITVAAATTWTLSAGVIIKFTSGGHEIVVDGTLNANGTSGSPVILSDDADDSAGGDTNLNGPSSGSPAQWRGLVFNAGSGGTLTYADVRYGGAGFVSNVEMNGASPTLTNCTIRNCSTHAMDLNQSSTPTVTNCTFSNNGGYAIERAGISAVPGITNNTAAGNGVNSIHVTTATLASNVTIGAASNLAGAILIATTISIPAGRTLTLNAGAILKMDNGGVEVAVVGTLLVNGAAGNPVILTDDADDSAGGDTNNNGPSVGGATSWRGIVFQAGSSASALSHADVRYGGSGFVSNVEISNSNPTITNCTIRNCYTHGMDLNATSSPTVSNCTFMSNGGYAIESAHISAVPGITSNTASGNSVNSIHVTSATLGSNVTISAASNLTGGILIATSIVIPSGRTLVVNPAVVLKMENGGVEVSVDGTLQVNGTSGDPVVFTDDADDTAGGDTNTNGLSSGGTTAWRGIVFNPTSTACSVNWTQIRFGGSGYVSNVEIHSASPTIANCTIQNCYTHGIDLNANSSPAVTNCTFTSNGGYAIESVPIVAVPGITNNTASANGVNSVHVTSATLGSNLTIGPGSNLGGAILLATSLVVPAGTTLTLDAGTRLKMENTGVEVAVSGALQVNGTAGNPVVFTDDADDTAGGDTNTNGASSGSPTAWRGIVFLAGSGGSSLTHADIRYGGSGYVSNVDITAANPTLTGCVIRDCWTDAMDLNANASPTVQNCTFTNNLGVAVKNAALTAVPGFTNNLASGNGGNYIRVTDGTVASALTIGAQSVLNGALLMGTGILVQPTGALTVDQGVVFKFDAGYEVTVDGALTCRGTAYEPVVFTDDADDSWGGDTNNNGPSGGGAAAWRGVTFNAGALASNLENVLIRYTGSGWLPGLSSASPNVALRSVRVDASYDRGFVLGALAGNPVNVVAWGCGGYGIQLTGGSFTVAHATAAANGTGIRAEPAFTGAVTNSIAYGNGSNFSNFGTGSQVSYSCGGFAGSNGNINVDPQFVNQAGGDLHLLSGSPCVGTADILPAFAVLKDHDENSRILDANLSGVPTPDMGAFEFCNWDMDVFGTVRLGTTVTFVVNGAPGESTYVLGVLDGIYPAAPYGILLAGAIPYVTAVLLTPTPIPIGTALPIAVPNDPGLIGLVAGVQALAQPTGNPAVGNLTQLYRVRVKP